MFLTENPEDRRELPNAEVHAGKLQSRPTAIFLYSELVGQNNNEFWMVILPKQNRWSIPSWSFIADNNFKEEWAEPKPRYGARTTQ